MWFYRLLLRLYPASFRAEYGGEMQADFARQRRETNHALLWFDAIADTVVNATRVHFDILRQDVVYAIRLLKRSPGFTFTAIIVAALGIGASTAGYTMLDHVMLRPLPFPQPDRLVKIYQDERATGYPMLQLSPPNFRDWRAASHSFESMAAYTAISACLTSQGEPQRLTGSIVNAELFPLLGIRPTIGRTFTNADDRAGAAATILLSHRVWTSMFAGDPGVIGKAVTLDNQSYTVLGVLPAKTFFPNRDTDFWMPIRFNNDESDQDRSNNYLNVIARLKPGATIESARAEMSVIAAQLASAYPKENDGMGATVISLRNELTDQSRMLLIAVFGAALCVLMIACGNLANLVLTRALARRREFAVRMAIGAGRERLMRQLLTENILLAVCGGVLGIALALATVPVLARLVPTDLPIAAEPSIDLRVLGFAALFTIATGIGFGVVPAIRAGRVPDSEALRGRSGTSHAARLRGTLVIAEVAGSVLLLVGAGLLVRALVRVEGVDPGFRPEGVLTMRTALATPKYDALAKRAPFYNRVLSEVRTLPGVTSAAYISYLPMVMRGGVWPVEIPEHVQSAGNQERASFRILTPGYFTTLGIRLHSGRDVTEQDDEKSPFVAIVSESFAKRYWPDRNPIGQHFKIAFYDRMIVGVAADVHVRGLERTSEPQIYVPYRQQVPEGNVPGYTPKDLAIKTSGDPLALVAAVRRIVHEADPQQPVERAQTLSEIVGAETVARRTQLRVIGVFAMMAIVLSGIGIHGLLAFAVTMRTGEVGVRIALGAQGSDILRMFLAHGILLGSVGLAIALPVSYLLASGMRALLFGVLPGDPLVYGAACGVALLMTFAGSVPPALRASRIDPAITMRVE